MISDEERQRIQRARGFNRQPCEVSRNGHFMQRASEVDWDCLFCHKTLDELIEEAGPAGLDSAEDYPGEVHVGREQCDGGIPSLSPPLERCTLEAGHEGECQ